MTAGSLVLAAVSAGSRDTEGGGRAKAEGIGPDGATATAVDGSAVRSARASKRCTPGVPAEIREPEPGDAVALGEVAERGRDRRGRRRRSRSSPAHRSSALEMDDARRRSGRRSSPPDGPASRSRHRPNRRSSPRRGVQSPQHFPPSHGAREGLPVVAPSGAGGAGDGDLRNSESIGPVQAACRNSR